MKRLLIFGLMAAIVSLAIVACKDDFNEEDFLRLQSELKLQQDSITRLRDKALVDSTSETAVKEYVAAINEAGDLLAVTLMVRENGVPVPGVTVSMTSSTANAIAAGRTQALQTGVTDASGNVVFDRVTIGSGTVTFRKTGYVGSSATIDFGTPSPPLTVPVPHPTTGAITNKYIAPTKRFEEAIIPLYSATPSVGSTATVSGRVIIENNVTNTTQEVPSGVVVRANLVGLVALTGAPFILNYVFEDNTALGVATVAANGLYTMTVPATAAGLAINLIIPNVEGTSRMAVNGYDNGTGSIMTLTTGPEYRDVPTSWGPNAPIGFGNIIPAVAGARLVFPTAPSAGSGLAFTHTPVPKSITTGFINNSATSNVGGTFYRVNSRGNYGAGSAPVVTITGGGGLGATAAADMRMYVSSLTVSNVGSGYAAGNVNINLVRVNAAGAEAVEAGIQIPVTAAGTLPSSIDLTPFLNVDGFGPASQELIGRDVSSLKVTVTGGGVPVTAAVVTGVFETEVDRVAILTAGGGYSSAPTFTFTGGGLTDGSSDHASLQIVDFPTFWTVTPNNAATSDYSIMPSFSVTYPPSPTNTIAPETTVDVFSPSGETEFANTTLGGVLTISGGDVVQKDPGHVFRTRTQSGGAPMVVVTTTLPMNAVRTLTSAQISATDGSITAFPGGGSNGLGYNSPLSVSVQPSITGAPGSGANISINSTLDLATREYSWNGNATFNNRGTGYLQNLNQKGVENASFPSTIVAQPGKTYTADINYGTGNRRANVN